MATGSYYLIVCVLDRITPKVVWLLVAAQEKVPALQNPAHVHERSRGTCRSGAAVRGRSDDGCCSSRSVAPSVGRVMT